MLEKATNLASNILRVIALGLLIILMLLTVADVFGRYVLDNPIGGTYELTEISVVLIVMLGLSYTQLTKSHVSVGIIVDRLSPKIQQWVDLFVHIIAFSVAVLIAWQGIISTRSVFDAKEVTDYLRIPVFYLRLFVPLGFSLLAMQFLLDIIRAVINLHGSSE